MLPNEPIPNPTVQRFEQLFAAYGLQAIQMVRYKAFANWAILLTSDRFRVRVYQDRGEVLMSIGLPWPEIDWNSGPWYAFEHLVGFLGIPAPPAPPAGSPANDARVSWYALIVRDWLDTLLRGIKEIESQPEEFARYRKQQFDKLFRSGGS